MADLSNSSFIPKQNPVKNTRRAASRQVYILTLVSYLLIISALMAAVGVFAYDRYTQSVLASEIESLNKEIADFNAEDMERVVDLNERLQAATTLLDMNVSLRSVLAIIEDATIDTVQFESLKFTRVGASDIKLDATIITDSFDSVLFQRQMYEGAKKLSTVTLEDVQITLESDEEGGGKPKNSVSFTALFSVNPSEALYVPDELRSLQASSTPATSTVPALVSSSSQATASTTTP
jgi:hypothetical protein